MTTISDLTRQVTFDDVWSELKKTSPDIDAYRESFEKIFSELSSCTPEENNANMTVYLKLADDPFAEYCFDFGDEGEADAEEDAADEEESAPYLQIFAYIPGDPDSYAIGVKPPEQIAGLTVADETLAEHAPAEIMAYVLAEITYSSSMASSTWGTKLDQAGGGIYAAQTCVEGGLHGLSLDHLREQLGLGEKKEDMKEKYGFLF